MGGGCEITCDDRLCATRNSTEWVRECSPTVLEDVVERPVPSREKAGGGGNVEEGPVLSIYDISYECVDTGREENEGRDWYLVVVGGALDGNEETGGIYTKEGSAVSG